MGEIRVELSHLLTDGKKGEVLLVEGGRIGGRV